jgi:hypothetical protein
MAASLFFMREYFSHSDFFHKIIELAIIILAGLMVYGSSSYFSGSLNILLKSNILKKEKNDIVPTS